MTGAEGALLMLGLGLALGKDDGRYEDDGSNDLEGD